MKVYNRKGLLRGAGICLLAIVFLLSNLRFPHDNGFQTIGNMIWACLLLSAGVFDCVRAFSKEKTCRAEIEEKDERNILVRQKGKAKALELLRGTFFLSLLFFAAAFKKTGMEMFAGMLVMAGLSFTLSYLLELAAEIYYERKE